MLKNLSSLKSKLYLEKYTETRMAQMALENAMELKKNDIDPDNIIWRYSMISVAEHHAKLLYKFFKDMRKGCIEELEGVYFENHKPDYLDDDEVITEDEYGFHGHYLFNINEGTFKISETLQYWIETHASIELAKTQAFRSYFKDVPVIKSQNGVSEPATNQELEQAALSRSYPLQDFFLDLYPKKLERIKEIYETKGDVSEIIRIIDGDNS